MKIKVAVMMVLVFTLAVMLASCGGKTEPAKTEKAKTETSGKTHDAESSAIGIDAARLAAGGAVAYIQDPVEAVAAIEAERARGSVTTPASWVAEDNSCDTAAIRSVEVSRFASNWRRISAVAAASSGRSCSRVSTKKR